LAGVPCLFGDADQWKAEWRFQWNTFDSQTEVEIQICDDELKSPGLSELTRSRVTAVRKAKVDHREQIRSVLAPLLSGSSLTLPALELHRLASTPANRTLPYYASYVARDWSWGEAENQASLALALRALGAGVRVDSLLVLGSGASRLAVDLHLACEAKQTIALDYNPLLILAAQSVLAGNTLDWTEIPIPPISHAESTAATSCALPKTIAPGRLAGFRLILADALKAPFAAGSFDCVVTPWFVDVVPQDLHLLLPSINRLLKLGGTWLHFGPFGFTGPSPSRRYSIEEVLEIALQSGFSLGVPVSEELPYLRSPTNPQKRTELVHSFALKKLAEAKGTEPPAVLPAWALNESVAVPIVPAYVNFAQSTQTTLQILSLVDGKRSLAEMADLIASQTKLDRASVLGELRGILLAIANRSG